MPKRKTPKTTAEVIRANLQQSLELARKDLPSQGNDNRAALLQALERALAVAGNVVSTEKK